MNILSLKNMLMMTPILLIALPVHEFAHGWVAWKMGDPTAKYAGRLTLNHFKQLDVMGVIMMYLAGVGWAKPVPVNSGYFKNRRTGLFLVALAGPLSNLLLGFLSLFVWGIIVKLASIGVIPFDKGNWANILLTVQDFFQTLVFVNISLAVFNLIPVPPLDGSRLVSSFVPEESYYRFARYEQYIGLAFLALVALVPDNIVGKFISFFALPIYRSMTLVVSFILGI